MTLAAPLYLRTLDFLQDNRDSPLVEAMAFTDGDLIPVLTFCDCSECEPDNEWCLKPGWTLTVVFPDGRHSRFWLAGELSQARQLAGRVVWLAVTGQRTVTPPAWLDRTARP